MQVFLPPFFCILLAIKSTLVNLVREIHPWFQSVCPYHECSPWVHFSKPCPRVPSMSPISVSSISLVHESCLVNPICESFPWVPSLFHHQFSPRIQFGEPCPWVFSMSPIHKPHPEFPSRAPIHEPIHFAFNQSSMQCKSHKQWCS